MPGLGGVCTVGLNALYAQFDETVGPEDHNEAEAIIAGIHKLTDMLHEESRGTQLDAAGAGTIG